MPFSSTRAVGVISVVKSFARKLLRFETGRRRDPIRRLKIGVSHLRFEPLEDRTVPAFDLLISPGPTFGVIASTVSTVTTFQANQVGATLSVDDVRNELNAGRSVIIDNSQSGAQPGDVVFSGVAGDETLTLSLNATNQRQLKLGNSAAITVNANGRFTFNGGAGSDTLAIDFVFGNPIPAGGLVFDGGLNTTGTGDNLILRGGNSAGQKTHSSVYTPSPLQFGDGSITIDGAPAIDFKGLEPVLYYQFASVIFHPPGDNDVIDIAEDNVTYDFDGVAGADQGLVISGTTGGVAFELLACRDNNLIDIDTAFGANPDGNDAITLTSANNNHQNNNLRIRTGLLGTDTVSVNGVFRFDDVATSAIEIDTNGPVALNAPLVASRRVDLLSRSVVAQPAIVSQLGVGTDIFANEIILRAQNDIGANADVLESASYDFFFRTAAAPNVSVELQASSALGSINLQNTGRLNVHNLLAAGAVGVAAGIDVNITTNGTFSILRDGETLQAAGNITITALDDLGEVFVNAPGGVVDLFGDIFTGGQTGNRALAATLRAIQSDAGATLLLTADRDIKLGDAFGWGDVLGKLVNFSIVQANANGPANIIGDLEISNSTLVQMFGVPVAGIPQLSLLGHNVSILNTGATFSAVQTAGGILDIMTDANGVLTIQAGGIANAGLGILDTVTTTANAQPGADINIQTDDIVVVTGGAGILALNAGIGALNIALRTNAFRIEFGDTFAADPGTLNLNNAEVQLIRAAIVRVGGEFSDPVNNPIPNTGEIQITQPIAQPVGWNTLALRTQGQIIETAAGGLTVDNLLLIGLAGVNVCDGTNTVQVLAGRVSPGNNFVFSNQINGDFTIGTVDSVSGIAAPGVNVTTDGLITLYAPNAAVRLTQPVLAGLAGAVRITSGQGVTQTATGQIVAGLLGVRNQGPNGDIVLDTALANLNNKVGTFAAQNDKVNGQIALVASTFASNTLTVGTVGVAPCFTTATTGVQVNNQGFVSIRVDNGNLLVGKLAVDAPIQSTTVAQLNTVRLSAISEISEGVGGIIKSTRLLAVKNGTVAGDIELGRDNFVTTFTASNLADNSSIGLFSLNPLTSLTVDTFAGDAWVPAIPAGVRATTGNVVLATTGALQLNQQVRGNKVILLAYDGVAQNAANGFITASELGVENAKTKSVVLDSALNAVSVFAAFSTAPKVGTEGRVIFQDSIAVAVRNVVVVSAITTKFDALAGIVTLVDGIVGIKTANGDVLLKDSLTITIQKPIDAGTALVGLTATAGIFEQTNIGLGYDGTIRAGSLGAINDGGAPTGSIILASANTITGVLVAHNTAINGTFYLTNTGNLLVKDIAATDLFVGFAGIQTNDGEIGVENVGSIRIEQKIDAGTSASRSLVALQATTGIVEATATGTISAAFLAAFNKGPGATGDIDLFGANNIDNPNDANVNNRFGNFAARNDAPAGKVLIRNTKSLNVTAVAGIFRISGQDGIFTTNGDVVIRIDGGALNLWRPTNTNSGLADVRLQTSNGISQIPSGLVFTDELAAKNFATGSIFMSAGNEVRVFAGQNNAANGAVLFINVGDLIVDTIAGDPGRTDGVVGVLTNNGAGGIIGLTVAPVSGTEAGSLAINSPIDAGTSDIRLHASGGVTQSAAGLLRANLLGVENVDALPVSATGNIDLMAAVNTVNVLAARNQTLGGSNHFRNQQSLTIDAVSGIAAMFNGVVGVETTNVVAGSTGDNTIVVNGSLTLTKRVYSLTNPEPAAVTTAVATTRLFATLGISEGPGGQVVADRLAVQNLAGDIVMTNPNYVNTFAAFNAGAGNATRFVNIKSLSIGTVAGLPGRFTNTVGIHSNNGLIAVNVIGDLTVNSPVESTGGAIAFVTSGNITTNALVSSGAGTIGFDAGSNIVTNATVASANGAIAFTASNNITTNALVTSGGAKITFAANNNIATNSSVTSSGGDINFTAAGNISVNSAPGAAISSSGGKISFSATKDIVIAAPVSSGAGTIAFAAVGNIVINAAVSSNDANITFTALGNLDVNQRVSAVTTITDSNDAGGTIAFNVVGKTTIKNIVTRNLTVNGNNSGVPSGSLEVDRSAVIVYDRIDHLFLSKTDGSITYTATRAALPIPYGTMTLAYFGLKNPGTIIDKDLAVHRTFTDGPAINNQVTRLGTVSGVSQIDKKNDSTMRVSFALPYSLDAGAGHARLEVNIGSTNAAAFDATKLTTLTATAETDLANPELNVQDAAIYIGNLAGNANQPGAPGEVYVRIAGNAGKDRFIFKNDAALLWRDVNGVLAPAMNGLGAGNDTIDYSLFKNASSVVTVDYELDRAVNLNQCANGAVVAVENVVVGNLVTTVTLVADAPGGSRAEFVVGSTANPMPITSLTTIRVDVNIPISDIVRYFGVVNAPLILNADNASGKPGNAGNLNDRDDYGQDLPNLGTKIEGYVSGLFDGGSGTLVQQPGIVRAGGKGGVNLFATIYERDANGNIIVDTINGTPIQRTAPPTLQQDSNFISFALGTSLGRNPGIVVTSDGVVHNEILEQTRLISSNGDEATSYIFIRQFLSKGYDNYNGYAEFFYDQLYRIYGDFFQKGVDANGNVAPSTLSIGDLRQNLIDDLLAQGVPAANVSATITSFVAPMLKSGGYKDEAEAVFNFVSSPFFQAQANLEYQGQPLTANQKWAKAFINSSRVLGKFATPAIEASIVAQLNADSSPAAKINIARNVFNMDQYRQSVARAWVQRFVYAPVEQFRATNPALFQTFHLDRRADEAYEQALGVLRNGTLEFAALEQVLNSEAMWAAAQINTAAAPGLGCC